MIEIEEKLRIFESFSEDDKKILKKVQENKFESLSLLNLRLKAEEIAKESEIKELISYNLIKKNLEYNLPHQQEGALKISMRWLKAQDLMDGNGLKQEKERYKKL